MDVEIRDRALWRLEAFGALGVIIGGVLLHFAYDWSGGNRLVAVIAPVNESEWKHLKLVVTPVVVVGVVEAARGVDRRLLSWAKLVEVVAASVFIVAFFYTYTGALGVDSNVAVDILSFLVAIAGGQWLSYRIIVSGRSRPARGVDRGVGAPGGCVRRAHVRAAPCPAVPGRCHRRLRAPLTTLSESKTDSHGHS